MEGSTGRKRGLILENRVLIYEIEGRTWYSARMSVCPVGPPRSLLILGTGISSTGLYGILMDLSTELCIIIVYIC